MRKTLYCGIIAATAALTSASQQVLSLFSALK